MSAWTDFVGRWKDCNRCPLHQQRHRICLARGTVPADVCFVGEAPGTSEDATGLVFNGPAGDLLAQIIRRAVPPTVSYAMTNLVCCFPRDAKACGDNEPTAKEIMACHKRLVEFVNIVQPRLIVCVGDLAARWVPHDDSVKCAHIVHPAFILSRMPTAQKNMATQNCVNILRRAVEAMLESPCTEFTKWGNPDAYLESDPYRAQFDRAVATTSGDIPF